MRTLLVLARMSNLPTVWSDCLAAWLLAGGTSWGRLAAVCFGATLLYTGGMFLNDAVDQGFDQRYRPERPIVSGQISSRTVWILSVFWLASGALVLLALGPVTAVVAVALIATIVAYDLVHKRTILAPILMAGCRFLLYLLAAGAAEQGGLVTVLPYAASLAAYIVGLSYLARGESNAASRIQWPAALLFVPSALALMWKPAATPIFWVFFAFQILWTSWCLWPNRSKRLPWIPRFVAGLLAGITLVDGVAAVGHGLACVFLSLFLLAMLLQRIAPAT